MSSNHGKDSAFAFYSDGLHGRQLYFRTFSIWDAFVKPCREIRRADQILVSTFDQAMTAFGDSYIWLRERKDIRGWVKCGGWALSSSEFTKAALGCLLEPCTCVRTPLDLYSNVKFPRGRASARRIHRRVRERVLGRDGHQCLICKRKGTKESRLTMHHVIPYSRGGQTAENNLVTLCESCNQKIGANEISKLFSLAGLHHGWDTTLIKAMAKPDALTWALQLSSNILISFCDMRLVPGLEES